MFSLFNKIHKSDEDILDENEIDRNFNETVISGASVIEDLFFRLKYSKPEMIVEIRTLTNSAIYTKDMLYVIPDGKDNSYINPTAKFRSSVIKEEGIKVICEQFR